MTSLLRFALTLLLLALLLPACGGSSNDNTSNDPITEPPDVVDPIDPDEPPDDQASTVLKISDIQTLASPATPMLAFNSAGDGMAVWQVSSKGVWLYYSHYDHISGNWSRAERLAPVTTEVHWSIEPQIVSSGSGFAFAWVDADENLYVSLFHDGAWVTKQVMMSTGFTYLSGYQLTTNGQGYLVAWYTWTTKTDSYELNALISQSGVSWSDEQRLYFSEGSRINLIDAVSNGIGYLVLVDDTDENRLLGSQFDGSSWQNTEEILGSIDGHSGSIYDFDIKIASNGDGYALVWLSTAADSKSVLSRIYTPSGGWSSNYLVGNEGSALIDLVSNGTGYCLEVADSSHRYLVVDSDGDGNWGEVQTVVSDLRIHQTTLVSNGEGYALAWSRNNDSGEEYRSIDYYASVYQDGEWVSTANPVATYPFIHFYDLDSVFGYGLPISFIGQNGEYFFAFKQEINGNDTITAIQYDNINGWSEAEVLEIDPGAVSYPAIEANPQEGVTVIWHQVSDDGSAISTYRNQRIAKQWQGKQLLSEGSYWLGSSYDTRLIGDDDGSTLAVWSQDRNGYRALFANIKVGEQWRQTVVLSDSITETEPQISTNGNGFTITWEEHIANDSYQLKAVSFNVDEWSESVVLGINLLHQSQDPIRMVLASNGDSYMLLYSDSSNRIARLFDGAAWSKPAIVAEDIYNPSGYLQIESNGRSYLSTWLQFENETMNIYSSEFDGVNWGGRQLVISDLELIAIPDSWYGYSDVPQLASNGENYAIFWFDRGRVYSSFYAEAWSEAEEIGTIETRYLAHGETPTVATNGTGYAVAWISEKDYVSDTLFANIYNGEAWRGVAALNHSSDVIIFDVTDSNNLIKASGDNYAIVWGNAYEDFEPAVSVSARVFDGTNWSGRSLLSDYAECTDFQLASDGDGFLVAWLQNDGNGQNKIFKSHFSGSQWSSTEEIDENGLGKYDLDLLGDGNGYQAIWNRAELDGDPWVRMPWAKSGL